MKVLFSAVGGSDPIKRMLDGPMLHCCRIYKPDVVYLFFTKKMLDYEISDRRYSKAIELLGNKLNHSFKIEYEKRSELTEVQLFDSYYDDFDEIFLCIKKKYPDAEIMVNVSSGTPAIKSALVIKAALSNDSMCAIQVSSGELGPVHDRDKDDNYDIEEQWECDLDNEEDKDRTKIIDSPKFLVRVKKENIERSILAYDYNAALQTANEIKMYICGAYKYINAAAERVLLDYNAIVKILDKSEISIVPIKDDKKRDIVEYILWLGVQLKRCDYLGFIRGITPAAMCLMEKAVKEFTSVRVSEYSEISKDRLYLKKDRLLRTDEGKELLEVLDKHYNGFRDSECTTATYEAILNAYSTDKKIAEYAHIIRKAEQELRNQAAHTIVSINDEKIKRTIGISAVELYNYITKFATRMKIADKSIWNSYEDMNTLIIEKLNK